MSDVEDQEEGFLEEEQIFFKRFSKEKQEQVRGLVQYATLMGLTGKDLISIGGKLDRLKESAERERNIKIAEGYELLPIGADAKLSKDRLQRQFNYRFKLKYPHGAYNFEYDGDWKVTSLATKVVKRHHVNYWSDEHSLPRSFSYDKRRRYAMLLDIHNGKFQLNF